MKVFDKEKIKTFSEELDLEHITSIYNDLDACIFEIINIVSKTAPISGKEYEFFAVNELSTGAVTVNSNIDCILSITAPQIELNTNKLEKKFYKVYWDRIKDYWKTKKRFRKRKRKNKVEQIELPKYESKYNMESLRRDVFNQLRNYFTENTTLVNMSNCISILCKDDIGININIYLCLKNNQDNNYKIYDSSKNKFITIDFKDRFENYNLKCNETDEKMISLIRVYNSLFYNVMGFNPNQILIESLMMNIPNEIYNANDDICEIFNNSLNYFTLSNNQNFKSICNKEINIFEENLITANEIASFYNFINKLKKQI